MKRKNKKADFAVCLLGTLGASQLGNLVTSKGTIRAGEGAKATSQGRGTIRAGQDF